VSFSEDELLPISALQHLLFCERQCALIHIEGLWAENRLTVQGNHVHERTDAGLADSRRTVRIARSLALRSLELGLSGRADVVEFHDHGGDAALVIPVEYKRGRAKADDCDRVQLCAQALCLEEMLGVPISSGALFYHAIRRRVDVLFDEELRRHTESASRRLHDLIASGVTPRAKREAKCGACSLLELCLPGVTGPGCSARDTFDEALAESPVYGMAGFQG
jgi:CRISPR-associated exonuclease Cas4